MANKGGVGASCGYLWRIVHKLRDAKILRYVIYERPHTHTHFHVHKMLKFTGFQLAQSVTATTNRPIASRISARSKMEISEHIIV